MGCVRMKKGTDRRMCNPRIEVRFVFAYMATDAMYAPAGGSTFVGDGRRALQDLHTLFREVFGGA